MKYEKKQYLNEGRAIGGGHFQYGGFPRILKESQEMRRELERHLDSLVGYGRELHDSNHPDRVKYGKILNAFSSGNFDNADELIEMGADPTAVGKYIQISSDPDYQKYMKNLSANADPTMGGLYSNE